MSATVSGEICPDCKHTHTGPELGWICIGCPCGTQPKVLTDRLKSAAAARLAAVPQGDENDWIDAFEEVVQDEHNEAHSGSMRFCLNRICRFVVEGS